CDESEVSIPFRGGQATAQKTALLAPRPGNCGGGGKMPSLELAPLAWKDTELDALINGEPVSAKFNRAQAAMRPRVLGTPRSRDGKLLVTPTSLGVLVAGDKSELWRVPDATDLHECAVSDGGGSIACIKNDGIVMYTRP